MCIDSQNSICTLPISVLYYSILPMSSISTPPTGNAAAASSNPALTHTCASCHAVINGKLLQCAACKEVWYCNKECQTVHWKSGGHRQGCTRKNAKILTMALSESDDGNDISDDLKNTFSAAVSAQLRAMGMMSASIKPRISNLALYVNKPGDPAQPLRWRDEFLTDDTQHNGRMTAILSCSEDTQTPYMPQFKHEKLRPLLGLKENESDLPPVEELEQRLQALAPACFHSTAFPIGGLIMIQSNTPWYLGSVEGKKDRVLLIGKLDL
jgi:hypothetical protein